MRKLRELIDVWEELFSILSYKQRIQCAQIMLLSLIGTGLELLGITLIVPFVQALTSPEDLLNYTIIRKVFVFFRIEDQVKMIVFLCGILILAFSLKNVYLCFLSYIKAKTQCKIEKDLSFKVLERFAYQQYEFFLKSSSHEINRVVGSDVLGVYQIISCSLIMFIDVSMVGVVCLYVFCVNMQLALLILFVAVVCILLITMLFKQILSRSGKEYIEQKKLSNQYVLQMLEGIKEVLLGKKQNYFIEQYKTTYIRRNNAEILRTFAGDCPGYIIEIIFITFFLLIITQQSMSNPSGFVELLPFLASFAVAAFKVLPLIAKISSSVNLIFFNRAALSSVSNVLNNYAINNKLEKKDDIKEIEMGYFNEIEIEHVSYTYENEENRVLNDINISIRRGEAVAFIGASGAGKTTLANVILGLLEPETGHILIDGEKMNSSSLYWNKFIGYVPQTVFMMDDSIRNNVAFGLFDDEIDDDNVWRALQQAQLDDFVKELPDQLDTMIGERGIRFSGGQRQRMAIARALYYDPCVLILDEATSALDNETEKSVMEAINLLRNQKTLIVVAHRLSTIRECDSIYEICDGKAIKRDKKEVFEE